MSDLINREKLKEEAIEEIKRWTPILLNSGQCTEKTSEAQDMAISALSENNGEWIYQQGIVPYKWRCNKCEKMFKTDFNYCPNCGADMRGEHE